MIKNPTTANFPGETYINAVNKACKMYGDIEEMQLCPQQKGYVSENLASYLKRRYKIKFRCHANVKVFDNLYMFDAASDMLKEDNINYINQLKKIITILGATKYSYHAGSKIVSLEKLKDNVLRLQDVLGIDVAVEGLYPNKTNMWNIGSWKEYEWLLKSELNMAIDMSHLQIVAKKENVWDWCLVKSLVASERCLEIHVSGNDGERDSHSIMTGEEIWLNHMDKINKNAVIFSEENYKKY